MIYLLEIPETRYIEINDQICMRREGNRYSTKHEAKDTCSTNDYCIGFMQMKFDIYQCQYYINVEGHCPEEYKEPFFQLCFNKGNRPFGIEDFDGNSIEQGHIMYKKENSGKI